jgi:hypothetical protein
MTKPLPTVHRFTVDEYQRMGEAGIFGEDDRVELIDGEIFEMTPIGREHAYHVTRLTNQCSRWFGGAALVSPQNPLRLGERDEPQPDLVLLRARSDFYRSGGPEIDDVLLVIEVADTSFEFDRRVKAERYAKAGLREYWILHVQRDELLVFRDPGPDGYRQIQTLARGQSLRPFAFPELELALAEILG